MNNLKKAYELGWIQASKWAKRDDLIADIGSPAYVLEAAAALEVQQSQEEYLTITWDEHQTRILAVTMQDEDGRILKVLAEAPAKQPQAAAVPFNHATQLQIAYVKGLGDGAMQAEAVPSDVVRDADVEAAAKKMAEIFDYPWDFMPEKGRNTMRENVQAVLAAAQGEMP